MRYWASSIPKTYQHPCICLCSDGHSCYKLRGASHCAATAVHSASSGIGCAKTFWDPYLVGSTAVCIVCKFAYRQLAHSDPNRPNLRDWLTDSYSQRVVSSIARTRRVYLMCPQGLQLDVLPRWTEDDSKWQLSIVHVVHKQGLVVIFCRPYRIKKSVCFWYTQPI